MSNIVNQKIKSIPASPTLSITQKAGELRSQGIDIISLSAGEPDFPTPTYVKEMAIEAINNNKTKYTPVPGIPELRSAIADKFKKENNIEYSMDQIIVGTGGKQVLFNAFAVSLNPGDEVIVPAPYWVSYPVMVELNGGTPVIIECDSSTDYKLTPELLIDKINDKTKWLVLNSPSNPTGQIYSKTELEALADVLRKYPHVNVISDDIYEHIIYDGEKFYTIAEVAPDLKERILTVNGVSKAYSMTGWRIGYAAGNIELIKAMGKIQSQSTSNACSISQYASIAALTMDQSFLKERKDEFEERRNYVLDRINSIRGIKASNPGGAFYLYVNMKELIDATDKSELDIVTELLEKANVAVVPGSAFGLSPYFRLSYATDMKTLEQAMNRIEAYVNSLF